MKVICLVPSWTETLIECGVNVVGRTRFCIHPRDRVQNIPIVGGTKDLDWEKVHQLQADILILDQEENLEWMKQESPIPVHVTHVQDLGSMKTELGCFAKLFMAHSDAFLDLQMRWERQLAGAPRTWRFDSIPGEIQKLAPLANKVSANRLVYVIWKRPWMSVSPKTWIGSVLQHLGAEALLAEAEKKYPEFELQDFDLEKTYFLFSSEPFPFHKKVSELEALSLQGSIVDGESYSWFGIRALRFLESLRA